MRARIVLLVAVALSVGGLAATGATAADSGAPGDRGPPATAAVGGPPVLDSDPLRTGFESDPDASETAATEPRLQAIYPNPYPDGDPGEYVVVRFPEPTNATGWRLVDDAGHVATLPNATLDGAVLLTPEPAAIEGDHGERAVRVGGRLRLANGGDAVALHRPDGTVVDRVEYGTAPEGERYQRVADSSDWRWWPVGLAAVEPVETSPASATAFVLPDAPEVVEAELRGAEDRILLAGYTLTSESVVEALIDAHERGVEVRVLLEGSPVGGVTRRQVGALDRLDAAGVPVTVLAGERDPFRFHHAKYAVVDDRAVVLSENWKPAGVGGRASRGWGVVLDDPAMARALAELFRADRTGPGSVPWATHRDDVDPVDAGPATGRFPRHFEPETVPVERARLLVSPDNARREVAALVRSADESVLVHQVGIDGLDDPLLSAALDAARNGTEVEILLGSARYVEAENRALATEIDELAAREDLPVSARLADPRGRYDRTHVKGVVVDGRHVVLGSMNWNPTAYDENREVLVVLTGEDVAGYYAEVFRADARGRAVWLVPIGLVGTVIAAWLLAGLVGASRIQWAR